MTPRHWMHWSVLGPMLTAAASFWSGLVAFLIWRGRR